MLDESFDKEDVIAFTEGKLPLNHFTHALKYSEDLEDDVTHLLTEIALINNWPDIPELESLHDLLKIIQQEVLHNSQITASDFNLHSVVVFANLLIAPGRSIRKDNARALDLLHQVLEQAPDFDYALASLAGLYLEGSSDIPRDPVKARDLFLEVIRIRPDYPFALAKLGEMYRLGDGEIENDDQASYHYLQRAVDADPEYVFALGSLGDLLRRGSEDLAADPKRAYKLLTKAYELDPYSPFVLASLADLLVSRYSDVPHDPVKAYELLEAANRITQENPFAIVSLADMLTGSYEQIPTDLERARSLLQKAVALAPDYAYALASLGELYYDGINDEEADYNTAYSYFERARKLTPNSTFILNHLSDLVRRGTEDAPSDLQRSCQLAGQSLDIDNNQPFALWLVGYAYKYMPEGFGDPAKACSYFQRALEIEPMHYASLVELGLTFAIGDENVEQNDTKAYDLFKRALAIAPENTFMLMQTAELLMRDNEYKNPTLALVYTKKVLELDHDDADANALLAHILISEDMPNDYQIALPHLEKAIILDPDNFYALYYLGLMLKDGLATSVDLERSRLLIEHAVSLWPEDEDFVQLQSEIITLMVDRTIIKQDGFSRMTGFLKKVLMLD